ncbi:protein kinase domain protein [Ichthyophthirius multifiliis]|uniref:Aurora kinase n=1 Tax=Ichthyophthirius multifiliis TaxID=5932 RepID=G0R0L0_ICHMU|nr:protein kinase domain protein [Ichthyophthirius multifiliis]EGR28996.1 protein kinase domain protein [Ichthyophthirius multifiliis]|eukprot:XP_004030232.1 protein kinase domain protein [Ichthyophthirius multifiliis]
MQQTSYISSDTKKIIEEIEMMRQIKKNKTVQNLADINQNSQQVHQKSNITEQQKTTFEIDQLLQKNNEQKQTKELQQLQQLQLNQYFSNNEAQNQHQSGFKSLNNSINNGKIQKNQNASNNNELNIQKNQKDTGVLQNNSFRAVSAQAQDILQQTKLYSIQKQQNTLEGTENQKFNQYLLQPIQKTIEKIKSINAISSLNQSPSKHYVSVQGKETYNSDHFNQKSNYRYQSPFQNEKVEQILNQFQKSKTFQNNESKNYILFKQSLQQFPTNGNNSTKTNNINEKNAYNHIDKNLYSTDKNAYKSEKNIFNSDKQYDINNNNNITIDSNNQQLNIINNSSQFYLLTQNQSNLKNNTIFSNSQLIFTNNKQNPVQKLEQQEDSICSSESIVEERAYQLNRQASIVEIKISTYGLKNIQIIKSIGQGKHSTVFIAQDKLSGFIFAIKRLNKSEIIEQEMEEQLSHEIKTQMSCNHPNIVRLYGYFDDPSYFYLLMEYLQGQQLSSLLSDQNNGVFDEGEAGFYLYQVASALNYLHKKNIIHRDIKADNIIVSNGIAKLADFGYSRLCSQQNTRNTFCGTLDYLSPEIVNGENYNYSVDVWAFGVLAYQLLQGIAPFYEDSQDETLNKIQRGKFVFQKQISISAQKFIKNLLNTNCQNRLTVSEIMQQQWIINQVSQFEKKIQNDEINQQILVNFQKTLGR